MRDCRVFPLVASEPYMLETQQAVQLCLSLPSPFRYIFLFLMGLPQADEMLHQHKNPWSFKVATRNDALLLSFFFFLCSHICLHRESLQHFKLMDVQDLLSSSQDVLNGWMGVIILLYHFLIYFGRFYPVSSWVTQKLLYSWDEGK